MSPLVAYHATNVRHREGIIQRGLLCSRPQHGRPFGVYVYRDDDGLDHPTFGKVGAARIRWAGHPPCDIYRVSYIGRMCHDDYVENGMVLLDSISPSGVTLVTRND